MSAEPYTDAEIAAMRADEGARTSSPPKAWRSLDRWLATIDAAREAEIVAMREERYALAQYHGGHRPTCGGMDTANQTCACGYLDGDVYREIAAERDAAKSRADEAVALLREARVAVKERYHHAALCGIGLPASTYSALLSRIDTHLKVAP